MKQQKKKDARRKQREKKRASKRIHHQQMMALYRQGKALFRPETDWMSRSRFASIIRENEKTTEDSEKVIEDMLEAGVAEADSSGRIRLRPGVLSQYLQMKEDEKKADASSQ